MKTLDEYMALPYRIEIIPDANEGGYVITYPDLRGCLATGETIEAAMTNGEDAKREWIAVAIEEGYPIPDPSSEEEYSGQFKLRIPKSLHRQLVNQAKREGISMNQYCVYLLSQNNARHAL